MKRILLITSIIITLAILSQSGPAPMPVTDYKGTVWGISTGVESTGKIHVLWTGKKPGFDRFTAFYSSSSDGVNWSPIQVLNQKDAFDPQVVVDDTRGVVHLILRSNDDGLLHFQVVKGTLGLPQVMEKETAVRPKVSLNSKTGELFGVWARVIMVEESNNDYNEMDFIRFTLGWTAMASTGNDHGSCAKLGYRGQSRWCGITGCDQRKSK